MSEQLLERPHEAQTQPEIAARPETINFQRAFHIGEQFIVATMDSSEFRTLCDELRVDPSNPNKPNFWRIVALCGADEAKIARESGNTSLQVDINELVTSTPDYVYNQARLNMNSFRNREDRNAAKQQARQYNALLRSFTEKYPDANPREFYSGLANVARICVTDGRMRDQGTDGIWTSMRGARQEVNFERMLDILGEEYERSTSEEDRKGIDYKLVRGRLNVDLKSSRHDIAAMGKDTDFEVENSWDGQTIKVLSPISNRDLGETLVANDEVLQKGAQILKAVLHRIRQVA